MFTHPCIAFLIVNEVSFLSEIFTFLRLESLEAILFARHTADPGSSPDQRDASNSFANGTQSIATDLLKAFGSQSLAVVRPAMETIF